MKFKLFMTLFFMIAVSCGPFPHQVMQEVTKDIPYNEVARAPESFRGSTVLWGGVIVETITRPKDTLILVRETELDFRKRPLNTDRSAGRFIIRHQGFLDPAIYARGREVTVVGVLAGKEERPVGELLYSYPIVESRSHKLWEPWTDSPPFYDPFYRDPFPYPWRVYPAPFRPLRR
jgi:outer membrane lipoprotein